MEPRVRCNHLTSRALHTIFLKKKDFHIAFLGSILNLLCIFQIALLFALLLWLKRWWYYLSQLIMRSSIILEHQGVATLTISELYHIEEYLLAFIKFFSHTLGFFSHCLLFVFVLFLYKLHKMVVVVLYTKLPECTYGLAQASLIINLLLYIFISLWTIWKYFLFFIYLTFTNKPFSELISF